MKAATFLPCHSAGIGRGAVVRLIAVISSGRPPPSAERAAARVQHRPGRRSARRRPSARAGAVRTRTAWRCRSCRRRRQTEQVAVVSSCADEPAIGDNVGRNEVVAGRPNFRMVRPMPPPSVKPATPVDDTRPPVVARPCGCVVVDVRPTAPPPLPAAWRDRRGRRSSARSITIPSSRVEKPACCRRRGRRSAGRCRRSRRGGHVGGAGAADDQRRMAVVSAVPDPARSCVA
jgi:hypothetical protein